MQHRVYISKHQLLLSFSFEKLMLAAGLLLYVFSSAQIIHYETSTQVSVIGKVSADTLGHTDLHSASVLKKIRKFHRLSQAIRSQPSPRETKQQEKPAVFPNTMLIGSGDLQKIALVGSLASNTAVMTDSGSGKKLKTGVQAEILYSSLFPSLHRKHIILYREFLRRSEIHNTYPCRPPPIIHSISIVLSEVQIFSNL